MSDGVEVYEGKQLRILFEGKKCIHSRKCVLGLPEVFLANVEGPWIQPDNAPAEELASLARQCPSGAIAFERVDGGQPEATPSKNVLAVLENGPYAVRADFEIDGKRSGFRATLCRCGASKNKPFCDGSHHAVNFAATGEPPSVADVGTYPEAASLQVTCAKDGPLLLSGPSEIVCGTGRTISKGAKAALCRCGASSNKPFCDGTHRKIGFTTE